MNYFWQGLFNTHWGARAGKYKLGARAGKYKFGARAGGRGRWPSKEPGAGKYKYPQKDKNKNKSCHVTLHL